MIEADFDNISEGTLLKVTFFHGQVSTSAVYNPSDTMYVIFHSKGPWPNLVSDNCPEDSFWCLDLGRNPSVEEKLRYKFLTDDEKRPRTVGGLLSFITFRQTACIEVVLTGRVDGVVADID